ncbi:uncharacterized protein LOC130449890 [Diorhabda sublineata]|uniref:uncharacterized protein LOC130449890 n=1 Tax=Diorhabda sublineata TaxID=1163346 RepID=UPI0024E0F7A3|nr:uncharacterized protein LOC130449890 [Diorhabda sublineata]
MAERWSGQENVKFVNLYREQENLWNLFDSEYKNRDARRTSLQHIAKEMNIPGFTEKDVTKKIKNLSSTYNQELIKIEKSKKSGSGTDDIYKPSIKWFDIMDYIMKVINLKEKETTSNLETHDLTEDSVDMSQTDEDINKDDTIGIARTPTAKKRNLSPKKGIKRNVVPKESTMHAAINELKDLNKSLRLPLEEKENECDIIGKHIAVQLKQLSVPDMLNANAEMQ